VAGTALALAVTIVLALPPPQAPAPAAPVPREQGERVNRDAKVMAEFEARVNAYSALHRKLEATLPDLPKETTPEQIRAHRLALGQLIARARRGAEPGDIFTKDTRALFRRYLARVFARPGGAELRDSLREENPGKLRLHVNGPYPEAIPVVTVPAQILEALPKLPEELEYRFIGERLVLNDIHAHTIVDMIEDAIRR
jgi:hypothetical protein